ncbi:hypothetical protein K435DRAFT_777127 [Dendrothele bispora CBS 962.96]|uniref:Uncharacterized protein n=1 Tax=Dendrothele bispora (strain CBS 962.96) TaxID=1314807 RepID=A0A4S8M9R9_DENBC|nr:hypothetical protein K435DRAFT_777127 [Dendrothele bispora CBS 962.96]
MYLILNDNATALDQSDADPSPEAIRELKVAIDLLFIAIGMLTWDIVQHITDDYTMLKGGLNRPIAIYLISRDVFQVCFSAFVGY